jgi:hypothetical protein
MEKSVVPVPAKLAEAEGSFIAGRIAKSPTTGASSTIRYLTPNARREPDLEIRGSEERSLAVLSLVPLSTLLELRPAARHGSGVRRDRGPFGLN